MLLSVYVAHLHCWNAYCFTGFGGLERFVCTKCTICLTVAFSDKNALKCILLHWLWWPRVLCLQQMHKFASLLLSVDKMHWNAYCFIGFGGLERFVCNRCTNLSHCCFQWHKCTAEMPILLHWLWWPRALCLYKMHKSASLLLSVAKSHWNAILALLA